MKDVKINKVECKRCGYSWIPRTDQPKECPKCKALTWKTERKIKKAKK